MNTNNKLNCSKSAVGFFSFFSSTNVETKNVCPIAYNSKFPAPPRIAAIGGKRQFDEYPPDASQRSVPADLH